MSSHDLERRVSVLGQESGTTPAVALKVHWQCPHEEKVLSCHEAQNGPLECLSGSHTRKVPHLHTRRPVSRNEGLNQPRFPTHSVELSALCDEVGWRVHLRNKSFVHDNHPVTEERRKEMDFRSNIRVMWCPSLLLCLWSYHFNQYV